MRALGALGMSVGTSAAFEGSGANSIRSADTVMFNLRTLVRNARMAYEKDDPELNDVDQLTKDVEGDIVALGKWLETARAGKPISMVVYYPSYLLMKIKFKHALLWEPTTDKQKAQAKILDAVAAKVVKKYEKLIVKTTMGVPDFKGTGIVLTHHVVDLTDVSGVARLHLLESYTGLLKPFTQWYTKLTGGEELYMMPFNRLTIQIFGDKSTNFRSHPQAIKEVVRKLAKDSHWTSATTVSRVRSTINNLPMGVDRAALLMML